MPFAGAYGVSSASRVVNGVIMIGQTLIECNDVTFSLQPQYSSVRSGIYIGTVCRFAGRVVAMAHGDMGGADGALGYLNNIYNALLAAASPYGSPRGVTEDMHSKIDSYQSRFYNDVNDPFVGNVRAHHVYRDPGKYFYGSIENAHNLHNIETSYGMLSEESWSPSGAPTTGILTINGKSFGITLGSSQPEETLAAAKGNQYAPVNGLYVPAPNMLSPLYVTATIIRKDANLAELVIEGQFTFYHGNQRTYPFAIVRYETSMMYQVGSPVVSVLTIYVRYLSRRSRGDAKEIGAMNFVPYGGCTVCYVNSIRVQPHDDGMGMTIIVEYIHDNFIFSASRRHRGVLAVSIIEDMSVIPPKSGFTVSSQLAGSERGLMTVAQEQEKYNQEMSKYMSHLKTLENVSSHIVSGNILGAIAATGQGILSEFIAQKNIEFTGARQAFQNQVFAIQKSVDLANVVVRTLHITVMGIPGAWPGELACFAANIANYFFFHWLRLTLSGIFKSTVRQSYSSVSEMVARTMEAVGIKDRYVAANLVFLVTAPLFGWRFAVNLAGGMGLYFNSRASELIRQHGDLEKAGKILYEQAIGAVSAFSQSLKVGGTTVAANAGVLGEIFRILGLEGVSVDSRYDHISSVYNVSVKAIFSDAIAHGLPMFYNHSLSNALDIGASIEKASCLMNLSADGNLPFAPLSMYAFVPYPISLGYNRVRFSDNDHGMDTSFSRRGASAIYKHNFDAAVNACRETFGNLVAYSHLPPNMKVRVSGPSNVHDIQVKADVNRDATIYDDMFTYRNVISWPIVGHTGTVFERLYLSNLSLYNSVNQAINNKDSGASTGKSLPLSPTASVIWYMYGGSGLDR